MVRAACAGWKLTERPIANARNARANVQGTVDPYTALNNTGGERGIARTAPFAEHRRKEITYVQGNAYLSALSVCVSGYRRLWDRYQLGRFQQKVLGWGSGDQVVNLSSPENLA